MCMGFINWDPGEFDIVALGIGLLGLFIWASTPLGAVVIALSFMLGGASPPDVSHMKGID